MTVNAAGMDQKYVLLTLGINLTIPSIEIPFHKSLHKTNFIVEVQPAAASLLLNFHLSQERVIKHFRN